MQQISCTSFFFSLSLFLLFQLAYKGKSVTMYATFSHRLVADKCPAFYHHDCTCYSFWLFADRRAILSMCSQDTQAWFSPSPSHLIGNSSWVWTAGATFTDFFVLFLFFGLLCFVSYFVFPHTFFLSVFSLPLSSFVWFLLVVLFCSVFNVISFVLVLFWFCFLCMLTCIYIKYFKRDK